MDLSLIWQDYGLDRLEEGIARLFPQRTLDLEQLFAQVMEGDIFGAIAGLFRGSIADIAGQAGGMCWESFPHCRHISWKSLINSRLPIWASILCTCYLPQCF